MFRSSEIFFLSQVLDKKFGKGSSITMATNVGLCQEHACAPRLCSPLPAPTGLHVTLNLVAAAVALHAKDRLVLV